MSRSSQLRHRGPTCLALLLVSTLLHYDAILVVHADDPAVRRAQQRDDSRESRHDIRHDEFLNPFFPEKITKQAEGRKGPKLSSSEDQTRERTFDGPSTPDFTAPLSTVAFEDEGGRHKFSIDEQNQVNPPEPQGGVPPLGSSPPSMSSPPTVSSPPTGSSVPSVSSRPSNSPTISLQPTLSPKPTTSPEPTLRPTTSHQPNYSFQPSTSSSPTQNPTKSSGPTQSPAPSTLPTLSSKPTNSNQPSTSDKPTATSIPTGTPTRSMQPTISSKPTSSDHPTASGMPTSSGKPTSLPTISLVPSQSSAPTTSASPTLPVGPMMSPSFAPSFGPSFTPSLTPSSSSVPTASGNVTAPPPATGSSPPEGCQASSIGTFGVTGVTSLMVRYLYEMQLDPNEVQMNQVRSQVVPEVENAITNTLLPVLFQEACNPSSSNNLSRMLTQQRRRLDKTALVGFNSRPVDVISTDAVCQSSDPQDSTFCVLVNGSLLLYSNETNANLTAFETDTLDAISNAMDKGDYNDVHPAIQSVTFRPLVAPQDVTPSRSSRRGLDAFQITMIVLSVILVVGVAVYFFWDRRRRRTQDFNKNDGSFSDSDDEQDDTFEQQSYQPEARNMDTDTDDVESSKLVYSNDQGREREGDTSSYGGFSLPAAR
eukprot:CAMPEP_0198289186 /NCGR_PEP_ID=MMETSP1449-20131203/7469_1 /TAXON_ID=420275 /ORGANISM="Attheya septentrionalis, Strain CCMP2084" /LENGTH=649 /DNA_ID=CAMNT_0043987483 /DNA_START=219 /DNA_END=2168 /DNA_ORIENTATION=+